MRMPPPLLLLLLIALSVVLPPAPARCAQDEFSQENATRILRHLAVDIGPRPMGSPGEQEALRFAVEQFRAAGCDTAFLMPMPASASANTTSGIAVGIKRGALRRMIVLGGHIDTAGPEIPGADDDGSGSAVVMELARVLGRRQTQSTLVFCCFGGEEQGLEGSSYFVSHFPEIDSVALMLQTDMANGLGVIDMDPDGSGGVSAPAWLPRAAAEEFSSLGYTGLRYPTHFFAVNYARGSKAGSDHEPFLALGIPAIDFSTDVSKPIHTPQDNFDNFDPRGLQRSGNLVLALARRFDGGVPQPERGTEKYWLMLAGATPLVVPAWMLQLFAAAALAAGALSVVVSYRRRRRRQYQLADPAGDDGRRQSGDEQVPPPPPGEEPPPAAHPAPAKIRWSGVKGWFFCLVIVACGWFSSDLISVVRGLRFPWFTSLPLYYLLAFLAMALGTSAVVRLSAGRIRLARSSFGFALRAVILLSAFTALLGLIGVKLMVEPAAALLLVSLAILATSPTLKLIFLALSPWWMLRIIFSEWDGLLFRTAGISVPATTLGFLAVNAGAVLFFSLYLLPFLYAAVAVVRDSSSPSGEPAPLSRALRSAWLPSVAGLLFVALAGYLLTAPVYDRYWYRGVTVAERYGMNDQKKTVTLTGHEYLTGLKVSHGAGNDTLVTGRTTALALEPSGLFDTTWVRVTREDSVGHPADSSTSHRILLTLMLARRPYTVTVAYARRGNAGPIAGFHTPFRYRYNEKAGQTQIDWYSFPPDTALRVPVGFTVAARDSVEETIDVTFDDLAYPMRYGMDFAYFLPRTIYTARHTYTP